MAFRVPSQKRFKPNASKGSAVKRSSIPSGVRPPSFPPPPTQSPVPDSTADTLVVTQHDAPTQISTQATLVDTSPTKGLQKPSTSHTTQTTRDEDALPGSSPQQPPALLPPSIGSSQITTSTGNVNHGIKPPSRNNATAGPGPSSQANQIFRQPSLPPPRRSSPTPSIASRTSGRGRPPLIAAAAATPLLSPAPSPARFPSASPIPGLPPVIVPAPASQVDGYGLPPSLRAASPVIDPMLRDEAGPSRSLDARGGGRGTSAGPRPTPNPAEVAAALVASIQAGAAPPPKKPAPPVTLDKNGRPRRPRKKREVPTSDPDSQIEPGKEGSRAGRKRKNVEGLENGHADQGGEEVDKPAPRKQKARVEPQYDEDGNRIPKRRGPYRAGGAGMRAGTDLDHRLSKYRARRKKATTTDGDTNNMEGSQAGVDPEGVEAVPEEPAEMTLRDFTSNFYEGELTERAIRLRDHLREKQDVRLAAKAEFDRQKWMRQQIMRRKARAEKNEDRRRRREALAREGESARGLEDEVSDDEPDSSEEYVVEPDRLTPPATPEPAAEGDGGERQEGEEEEDVEGLGLHRDGGDEEEGAEGGEPLFLPEGDEEGITRVAYGEGEGEAPGEGGEEDPLAGFTIREDAELEYDEDGNPIYREEYGYDGYEGEDGDYGFDIEQFRANRDARRERILQGNTNLIVEEDDDETKMINSSSFSKKKRLGPEKWTAFETEFFYAVLSEVGENYSLIKAWFPGRTVAQLKRKGLKENRENPEKMTLAILSRKPIDQKYLEKSAGYDPNRSWDKEDALFEEARQNVEKLKALDEEEAVGGRGDEGGEEEEET